MFDGGLDLILGFGLIPSWDFCHVKCVDLLEK